MLDFASILGLDFVYLVAIYCVLCYCVFPVKLFSCALFYLVYGCVDLICMFMVFPVAVDVRVLY